MANKKSIETVPADAPAKVEVQALKQIRAGNCVIAAGKTFKTSAAKAEEMVAAGAVVILPPAF